MSDKVTHHGSCHCGAIEFEVEAPAVLQVDDCNCSICRKSAYLHLIVPASQLRVLKGAELLVTYTFNTATARHTFCPTCGVKPFYVPRSNPRGFSVNLRCLDRASIVDVHTEAFDGRHWEQHAARLLARTPDLDDA